MSNSSLAIVQQQVSTLQEIQTYAKLFAASGMFEGLAQEAKCAVKIIAGRELGLAPFAAMSELHIIKGKITMSAGLLAKKVKASQRYDYRVKESSDKVCSIEFFENRESLGIQTYTIQQAEKAGVQNLQKFPQNMLFARAMSNGVRFYCPDVTGEVSVYTDGEIDEVPQPSQPLRVVPPVQPEAIEAEAVADDSYLQQIQTIAAEINADLGKALKFLRVDNLNDLSQAQAEKFLKQLEDKRAALEAEKAKAAPEPTNATSGLDQWLCTQETGARATAMNVLSAWDEAKATLNLTDDQLREEMAEVCGVRSRKELTATQANEFIAYLRDFINSSSKKQAAG